MRGLAAPGDDDAGLDLLRAQQAHDVGDLAGLEVREQRHARDHAPGHDEVPGGAHRHRGVVLVVGGGGVDAELAALGDPGRTEPAGEHPVAAAVLQNILFKVNALDPFMYFAVAGMLTLVAAISCFVPARRATRVDPIVALRYE